MAYQAAMMAEQERLAKAQKRNLEMASGSVGGSDDERSNYFHVRGRQSNL